MGLSHIQYGVARLRQRCAMPKLKSYSNAQVQLSYQYLSR